MTDFNSLKGRLNRLRINGIMLHRRTWQRWQNPSRKTQAVFIFGCGRSGTSMLVRHLGRSKRIDFFNENHAAAFERWRLRDLPVIESVIDDSHAEVALFKPILDTVKTNLLLSRFSAAKVIFVFRHFDDVINSSLKKFGRENRLNHVKSWMADDFSEFTAVPPPQKTKAYIQSLWKPDLSPESGAALYWLFYNQLYYDLHLDQHERVCLIQYESLVSNPEEEFRALCQYLGLSFEPQITKGVFSSSIRRAAPQKIDSQIRQECEALWERLSSHLELKSPIELQ